MNFSWIIVCLVLGICFFEKIEMSANHQNKSRALRKLDSCYYQDKKLYGKIQLVEFASQADLKVQIVNSFPDLKVQFVESFPDQCGEWQIVESFPDLKVFMTENYPDLKIQPVTSFPGL